MTLTFLKSPGQLLYKQISVWVFSVFFMIGLRLCILDMNSTKVLCHSQCNYVKGLWCWYFITVMFSLNRTWYSLGVYQSFSHIKLVYFPSQLTSTSVILNLIVSSWGHRNLGKRNGPFFQPPLKKHSLDYCGSSWKTRAEWLSISNEVFWLLLVAVLKKIEIVIIPFSLLPSL